MLALFAMLVLVAALLLAALVAGGMAFAALATPHAPAPTPERPEPLPRPGGA